MIAANNVSLQFGKRVLLTKSTSSSLTGTAMALSVQMVPANQPQNLAATRPHRGNVSIEPGKRTGCASPESLRVWWNTGNRYGWMWATASSGKSWRRKTRFMKPDFSEADGIRANELESLNLPKMNGWNAQSDLCCWPRNRRKKNIEQNGEGTQR